MSLEYRAANTRIGIRVTIGHQASLHGCVVEDEALIGIGATLLHGCKVILSCDSAMGPSAALPRTKPSAHFIRLQVEKGAMVAAGAVVAPGTVVPAGQIWGGATARFLRALKPAESKFLVDSAEHYVTVSAQHLKDTSLSLVDIAKAKGLA